MDIFNIIKSKINYKSVSEMGWVFLGQSISVILGFIIIKIISQLGPEEYGVYALILTIAAFLGLFYGSFLQGFLRYYYHYKEKGLGNIFVKLMYKFLTLSVIVFILLTIIISIISPYFNITYSIIFFLIAGLFVIASKFSEFFNSVLNLIRKRKENSLLQATEKSLMIAALLIFVYTENLKLQAILLTFGIIAIILSFSKILTFKKHLPKEELVNKNSRIEHHREMTKTVLIYVSPFLIWAFAGWLQLNGEKWILNGILFVKDVGIYAIMMSLVNALIVIPNNIINEFATPIIFKQFADMQDFNNMKTGYIYIKINMLIIILITAFATILTLFFGKDLITLISSKQYSVYWYLLPLLVLGTGLFYTGQAQTLLGLSLNQPKKYLSPKISIGLGSVALNLLMISRFGINGIAYSVLLIGFIYVIYITVVNKQIITSHHIIK
ncbi:MAG TPA: oligosaccharide flippase family protein [Ignavibacteriaceae bacterium]|nr:oligosaccharide flippase family protein [Ignavibacteriaceae bacterium]